MKKKRENLYFYLIPKIHHTYKFIILDIKQNKSLVKYLEHIQ
jgi:hypothetical protein